VAQPGRILVVEDETLVRRLLAQMIRKEGHEVLEAPTAEAAIRRMEEEQDGFDAVFTDLGLPGMSGWDLADWLRDRKARTAVVLVSGWGDEIGHQEMVAHGVLRILAKPFTGASVHEALSSVLPGR
jgi:DNA-binding response OmpR family regulator